MGFEVSKSKALTSKSNSKAERQNQSQRLSLPRSDLLSFPRKESRQRKRAAWPAGAETLGFLVVGGFVVGPVVLLASCRYRCERPRSGWRYGFRGQTYDGRRTAGLGICRYRFWPPRHSTLMVSWWAWWTGARVSVGTLALGPPCPPRNQYRPYAVCIRPGRGSSLKGLGHRHHAAPPRIQHHPQDSGHQNRYRQNPSRTTTPTTKPPTSATLFGSAPAGQAVRFLGLLSFRIKESKSRRGRESL